MMILFFLIHRKNLFVCQTMKMRIVRSSRLSTESLNENSSSTLRVKLRKTAINGNDDEEHVK